MAAVRMGKLTTVPAGLICASITVHAAKEEYKKQLVKPEQLPIYTAPPLQSKYVEEQPGHLQMGFASIRTTTSHYIGWCKGVYVFMKNGIMDTVQFGKDVYVYLKNPPRDFLPKIGVITVSGLAGLVSARKGSRFKKIAYPLGLATLGAAVCYPVQSVIIAKVTGKKAYTASEQIYEAVKSLWTKINKKESFPKPKEKPKVELNGPEKIDIEFCWLRWGIGLLAYRPGGRDPQAGRVPDSKSDIPRVRFAVPQPQHYPGHLQVAATARAGSGPTWGYMNR
uniref:MICOS complex subunit n=1 Tax=Canis lupus familiaris TaxID=9615 RepID=A0A8C0NSB4_CANLF